MKKSFLALICGLALFACAPRPAHALQDSATADSQPTARQWPSPEQVVAKLDSQLSLTDDQKAKITPIIAGRQQELKDLAASSGRRRKKARKAKSILDDSDQKIQAVLNDQQRQQYAQIKDQMRSEMRQHKEEASSNQ